MPGPFQTGYRKYTREGLIARMKELAERCGHTPTGSQLKAHSPPGLMVWIGEFGSIREAQEAAGLPGNQTGRRAGAKPGFPSTRRVRRFA